MSKKESIVYDESLETELRKSFDLCAEDKGYITQDGLRRVLSNIGTFSPTEILKLFKMMDLDGNGKIEWSEFRGVLKDWFQPTETARLGKRRRSLKEEREYIHRKIIKYFLQFKRSNKFEEIRNNLCDIKKVADVSTDVQVLDDNKMYDEEVDERENVTNERRLNYLNMVNKTDLEITLKRIMNPATAEDAIEACMDVNKVLRILVYYNTSDLRRDIHKTLINMFEKLEKVIPQLTKFLKTNTKPALQCEVLQIFTYIVNGPRIGNTPEKHKYHSTKTHFKNLLGESVDTSVELLKKSVYQKVQHQAMLYLATFSSFHHKARDYVLEKEVIKAIVDLFRGVLKATNLSEVNVELMRKASWCLSVFCGNTHQSLPKFEKIRPCLHLVAELLMYYKSYNDPRTLGFVLIAIQHLLPGLKEDTLFKQLMKMLDLEEYDDEIIDKVLTVNNNMFKCDKSIIVFFLKNEYIDALKDLLNNNKISDIVKSNVLTNVNTICKAGHKYSNFVIKSGMIKACCQMILKFPQYRNQSIEIILSITKSSLENNELLVFNFDMMRVLTFSLSFLRNESQNDVINKLYQKKVTFEYDMVRNCLTAMNNILNSGETGNKKNVNGFMVNTFIQKIDKQVLDNIGKFLLEYFKSCGTRLQQEKAKDAILKMMHGVLTKVKFYTDQIPAMNMCSVLINQLFDKFFKFEQVTYEKLFEDYSAAKDEKMEIDFDQFDEGYEKMAAQDDYHVSLKKREKAKKLKSTLFGHLIEDKANKLNLPQMEQLFQWWMKNCDVSNGYINKKVFKEGMKKFSQIQDDVILEQNFKAFDEDGNGNIDFREFAIGLSLIMSSKKEKRKQSQNNLYRLLFNMYDLDNNGSIDRDELFLLFKSCYEAEGKNYTEDTLRAEVNKKFDEIDIDSNGVIDFEEFISAVKTKILKVGLSLSLK